VHHEVHMDRPRIETGPALGKDVDYQHLGRFHPFTGHGGP